MSNYRNRFGGKETQTVSEDGEVLQSKTEWQYSLKVEDNYVKLYTDDLEFLLNLPKRCLNVLIYLLKNTDYANRGGYILLPCGTKKEICQALGLDKVGSLDNVLSQLVKGKIILRESTGIYKLNPFIFGKGAWPDVVEMRENNMFLYGDTHNKHYTDYVPMRKGGNADGY